MNMKSEAEHPRLQEFSGHQYIDASPVERIAPRM